MLSNDGARCSHVPVRFIPMVQSMPLTDLFKRSNPSPVSPPPFRWRQTVLSSCSQDRTETGVSCTLSLIVAFFHCRSCLGRSLGQGQCWFLACLTGWGTLAFLVGLRALGVTFAAMCWETDADAIRVSKKSFRHV